MVDIIYDTGGHSRILVDIITGRKVEKFAEIGVFKGRSARYILRKCGYTIKEYWGIDKYNTTWNGITYRHPKIKEKRWNDMYRNVCRYCAFFPQFKILKMSSEEAVELFPKQYFPNGYFDFVYIDADHSYEMVKKDINLWFPLVKKWGLIGGHDYGFPDEVCRHGGVQKAVDEIFYDKIKVFKNQGVWLYEK